MSNRRTSWQVEAERRRAVVLAAFEAAVDCDVLRYDGAARAGLNDMRTDGLLSGQSINQLRAPIDAEERIQSRVRVMRDLLLVIAGFEDSEATLHHLTLYGTDDMARAVITALSLWFELERPLATS